jgi:DNA (cytosine-5)-methyltransferase 1
MFSGFEGFGIGAKAAGCRHLWGIEYSTDIAAVAEQNGFRSIVADVRNVDFAVLERPSHLHASPVCKNASVANVNGEESDQDIETAEAVCRAIEILKPDTFSLENVSGYREFKSFYLITSCLYACGYFYESRVLNAADFGVPQTRKRLILLARRDGRSLKFPPPTHAPRNRLLPMFETRLPWVGWYEAIADIVGELPDSAFTPWQLKRMPREILQTVSGVSDAYEPTRVVSATNAENWRAFIVDGRNVRSNGAPTFRYSDDPMITIVSSASRGIARALLPMGRIVRVTPRALARFQSFPDSYQLPSRMRLACEGIGNAVPPLMAQRIMEAL